jgi:transposase-like protein
LRRKKSRFLEQSDNKFLQIARDFVEVCPNCKSFNISVRQRKIPKYRCQNCKNEFDDPKAEIVHKTIKQQREIGRQYDNPDK